MRAKGKEMSASSIADGDTTSRFKIKITCNSSSITLCIILLKSQIVVDFSVLKVFTLLLGTEERNFTSKATHFTSGC